MRAEIISVGTELLLGQIVDTNAAYLSRLCPQYGIDLYYRVTVGDNASRLAEALERALARADLVFTIGGLGPTEDDLTRETVARVVGDEMVLDAETAADMRAFFKARGIDMPETNLKQAMVPTAGRSLRNPMGTAPGAVFEWNSKAVIVLPGPPREFVPMVDSCVAPYLRERAGEITEVIRSRVLRIAGLGESSVEDKVKHLLRGSNPTVAPLAGSGEVHLRITAKAANEQAAEMMIDEMDARLVSILGNAVFGRDSQTLEQAVVEKLIERGLTLATAESCTGGLIASRITDVSGSSAAFLSGIVAYSNEAKKDILGVPEQLIRDHGAVSEEVARAMAEGAKKATSADAAVAVTGIAGPTGGTPEKPVGLVYIGLSLPTETIVERFQFPGGRADVKLRASQAALDMVRTRLD